MEYRKKAAKNVNTWASVAPFAAKLCSEIAQIQKYPDILRVTASRNILSRGAHPSSDSPFNILSMNFNRGRQTFKDKDEKNR